MATITSRQGLIDYCLRRLGDPVIEINIDVDQLEDKVDDALQVYQEFHSDATYRTYLKHQVTQDDLDNDYITISSNIVFVSHMFAIDSTFNTNYNFFDIKYQMMLNDLADLHNWAGDMAYYEQMNQYLTLLDMKLNGMPQVNFSRRQNRLYVFGDLDGNDIQVGDYIVAEVYQIIDPETHTSVYNDMFIKDYSTALIKQQWGANLKKFEGMQLPGGVILNGQQLYDEASEQIEMLRERVRLEHEEQPFFFVG